MSIDFEGDYVEKIICLPRVKSLHVRLTICQSVLICSLVLNTVPSWDIEGHGLASVRRYLNEGQYSSISVQ